MGSDIIQSLFHFVIGFYLFLSLSGIEKILELVGIYGESIVQEAFETGGFGAWEPIKEATANRKGSSQILIDSSQLRRSVISKVEKRNN